MYLLFVKTLFYTPFYMYYRVLLSNSEICFRFAETHNLPILNNVTLPRIGAMNTILTTVGSIKGTVVNEN